MLLPNKLRVLALGVLLTPSVTEPPPAILQIYRDPLLSGHEATYRAAEEDAARFCAELSCPNPHLAIESLTGPKEVWWLNAYESETHKQQVASGYANNAPLMAALAGITKRREGLIGPSVDLFANYRADLSGGAEWKVAGARFFAVTVTKSAPKSVGSVFEAPDGTRFVFRAARTRQEAEALASAAGPETIVFAIRPYWGMPAKAWIAADPEFWKPNPMAK